VAGDLIQIKKLAQLTTVPLEIGNISHKILRTLLKRLQRTSAEIDLEKFFDYAHREAYAIFRSKLFDEVYYRIRDEIDFENEIYEPVRAGLENFLRSERLEWLFEEALVTKADWVIEPDGFGEFRMEELKAYAKVDFIFPIGDELHILDWKTGKEDYKKHSIQLRGYAYWANFHLEKEYSQIDTTIAHLLPEYKENSQRINEYDIEDFSSVVRSQTEEMYGYCAEPELNIPLPKDEFRMTPHENFCKTCKFRELCDRR
jgi:predicted RecB family nuclease